MNTLIGFYDDGPNSYHTRNAGSAVFTLEAGDNITLYNQSPAGFVYGTTATNGIYNAFNIVRIG